MTAEEEAVVNQLRAQLDIERARLAALTRAARQVIDAFIARREVAITALRELLDQQRPPDEWPPTIPRGST